ncbi:MAG: uncharacterized protein PWP51_694 [Clostridiales bacterium]|jgi:uncharacterized membrane protein YfcA|nr:uncharacterized protein [Clostridiales bacterium]
MTFLQSFDFTTLQWSLIILAAMLIGFSKTAIGGVTLLAVPILAGVFGGKASTGVMLMMLITGDLFAVRTYYKHADWQKIKRLFPFTICGVLLGVWLGALMNDAQFAMTIACSVIVCLGILIYFEVKGERTQISNAGYVAVLAGILGGFTSMIGNAAGPVMSIYFLAMGYQKRDYMGTNALFFFLLNLTKLPFQIFVWHNITWRAAGFALSMLIPVAVGAIIGIFTLKRIDERVFRYIVMGMTAIAAVKLLLT